MRVCWPGLITRFSVAPANVQELSVVPELAEGTFGLLIGDRNYYSPKTGQELAGMGVELLARTPPRQETRIPKGVPFSVGFATG